MAEQEKRTMVIRTDDDSKDWIWKKMQEGSLKQGWGFTGTQFIEKNIAVNPEIWKERYIKGGLSQWGVHINDEDAIKRYWILYPMTELKRGDIIVVPKMPQWDTFSVALITEGYVFDYDPADKRDGDDDFRHSIIIDKNSIKTFNYAVCEESRIVKKKMRAYQSAVNNVWNTDFINAIDKLLTFESDVEPKDIVDIFAEVKSSVLNDMLIKLRKLTPSDLENLVANLFEKTGYEVVGRNVYDGHGGDADIVVTTKVPLISEYIDTDLKVYIQVKQKEGNDWNDVEGIEQLQKISKLESNVMKILVSSVDEFSTKAKALAADNNVILMNGKQLIGLMARYL